MKSTQAHSSLEEMVAKRYHEAGYEVFLEPEPTMIPFDLGHYRPDIFARKDELNLIIEVKSNLGLGSSYERLREVIEEVRRHEGWRFVLVSEKPYFLPIVEPTDLFRPYYVHPKMSNRRILAQSGAFILYGIETSKKVFQPYPIEEEPFVIPLLEKKKIREALENLGINESTLFPEIDKAAARIKNSYTVK